MKNMSLDAFRFSISWSRVLPRKTLTTFFIDNEVANRLNDKLPSIHCTGGKLSGGVNKKGIEFYNDLINKLLSEGQYFN